MKKYYISLVILMLSLISSAKECDNLIRTTGIYWETDNLIEVIQMEYGTDYTIGDWLDLKALTDIDEWITCMELVDDDQFILTRDGEYIYSGNRQYFVQYFADGDVPGTWLVHDHIGNKLFLGSWYGIEMSILAINTETSLMLTSPNGGEYWKWDTQQLINWTANDSIIENVNIWLSYDSGASYDDLLFENTANDGEEPWTIPEAQCNTARIKIEGHDAEGLLVAEDESNDDFFIYTTPPVSLDSGLVAYYPFNGNANDESENDNHGTVYGATLSTDRFGNPEKAYAFDGIDDYISVEDHESLRPISLTISCFVNFDPPFYTGMHIISKNLGDANWESYTLMAWPSNPSVASNIANNDGHGIFLQAPLDHEDLKWHHLVFTFDDPGDMEKLFIDGEFISQANEAKSIAYDDKPLYISGDIEWSNPIPEWFFKGKIDDVRIYDRVLNEFEIQALYHEGDWKIKPSFITNLSDQAACKNDSVALEAIAEGIPPINYQWQKDGIDISGATDSILIIPHVQAEDDGEYRCTATNDHGTGSSNTATLSVEFANPTKITGFTGVHEYQVATYSADMQEGHTYEFFVEGGNVIDGTENSITVHWGEAGQGFIYLLEQSELGCFADTNTLVVAIGYLGVEDHETNNLSVFPNPFSTSTTIEYTLIQPQTVKITFYNQAGKVVDGFENRQQKGLNKFIWTPSNLPNGVYYFKLEVNTEASVGKILLAAH